MSIRVFSDRLDAKNIFATQKGQYSEKLVLSDTVPANSSKLCKTGVSNLGHFMCLLMTGKFSTLYGVTSPGAATIDDGINHLSGQLIDGAGQKKLFNDYVPFDLLFSPGRVKTTVAVNAYAPVSGGASLADKADSLFYPSEFEYLFTANSDILIDVKNNSNVNIPFSIVFHGIRILTGVSVKGITRN